MPEKPNQDKIIAAIEKTDYRITAADLVIATGMSYNEAVSELNKIAATKFGIISVNDLGKIVYKFPHGIARQSRTRSLAATRQAIRQAIQLAKNLEYWIYYLACFLLILSPLCFLGLALMLAPVAPGRKDNGDQWASIATFIRQRKGVLAIEELAPHAYIDPSREEQMLPILIRFNGRPEVSPSGSIFYVFPDLIATAKEPKKPRLPAPALKRAGDHLDTNAFWYFKVAVVVNLFLSFILLAAFNRLGVHPAAILVRFWFGLSLVMTAVGLLRWYRFNAISSDNDQRKNTTEEYAQALANPAPSLVEKLKEVDEYRHQRQGRHHKEIVYSTDLELLEQAKEFRDNKKAHDQQ
jgi:hypothetical protein